MPPLSSFSLEPVDRRGSLLFCDFPTAVIFLLTRMSLVFDIDGEQVPTKKHSEKINPNNPYQIHSSHLRESLHNGNSKIQKL